MFFDEKGRISIKQSDNIAPGGGPQIVTIDHEDISSLISMLEEARERVVESRGDEPPTARRLKPIRAT